MTKNDLEELERQSAMIIKYLALENTTEGNTAIAAQFDRFIERHHLGIGPMNAGLIYPTETETTESILHPYFMSWCFFVGIPIHRLRSIHRIWAKKLSKGESS